MAGASLASAPPRASKDSDAGESSAARSTRIRLQGPGARRETSAAKSCSRSARKRPIAAIESRPIAPWISTEAPSNPATVKCSRVTFGPLLVALSDIEPLSISASPTRAIWSEPALSEIEKSMSLKAFASAPRLGSELTSSESLARSTTRRRASPPTGPANAREPVRAVRSRAILRLRPENPVADASTAPDSEALR